MPTLDKNDAVDTIETAFRSAEAPEGTCTATACRAACHSMLWARGLWGH